MTLADVNVLIHAFRSDSPQHRLCRAWLQRTVDSGAPFGLSPLVLSAVIRIASNPRIFVDPDPVEEAFAFCEALLDHPGSQIVEPGDRHWRIFRRLCFEARIGGPMITDAWFAALAIEHGCVWITCDSDFRRFPGLEWRAPEA